MTKTFPRTCAECGECFQAKRREAEFCGDKCRKTYNNRRAVRGAELYDLMMKLRFERPQAKLDGTWGHACALLAAYNDSDKARRPGRKSYNSNAHRDLPLAYSAGNGDGR